jgi:hypothetical protein
MIHLQHFGGAGQTLPLVTVITKTLEYVKNEALQEINKSQIIPLKLDDIQWVLTVPAIWSDIAKARTANYASAALRFPFSQQDAKKII